MNISYLTKSREAIRFTKSEVSRYLGVTRMAITHWESGYSVPKYEHIIKLCKLLDMDANILLELKGVVK